MTTLKAKQWLVISLIATPVATALFAIVGGVLNSQERAEQLYHEARRHAAKRETPEAEVLARQAANLNPNLGAAALLAAECAVLGSNFEQALEDLSRISEADPKQWIRGRLLAADILHNKVHRFSEAELAYREVLKIRPDNSNANEGLARLLAVCGRRADSIPHILKLIRAGKSTDLLMLLSQESGAIRDPDLLEHARIAAPDAPNPLLGQAHAAYSQQKTDLALEKLESVAVLNNPPEAFYGAYGRELLSSGQVTEVCELMRSLAGHDDAAEVWRVKGDVAERLDDQPAALRCYWEAVKRNPESRPALNGIARLLKVLGRETDAAPFMQRIKRLNKLHDAQRMALMSDKGSSTADFVELVHAFESVGRLWEAFAWGEELLRQQPEDSSVSRIVASIKSRLNELPLKLTDDSRNPALALDLSSYPLPKFDQTRARHSLAGTSPEISFRRDSANVGFEFSYYDGTVDTTGRMFELAGGGLAAIDMDNDEAPDIYCTQGRKWRVEEGTIDQRHDTLFRNHHGHSFTDVADLSGVSAEQGFGQGVAAGDVNNDGFIDLYIAHTGENLLWLNNGDGTFSENSAELPGPITHWTTSCLIADVNGDSVPDLYDVNYLSGSDLFERVCTGEDGSPVQCLPYEFEAAPDALLLGQGDGRFINETDSFLTPPPNGKGLGAVAANDGHGGLSLFVANDTTANFFYTTGGKGSRGATDVAPSLGLAFNSEGKAEAGMGIAAADCTQDGLLDLFVTNFLHESNTLYSQENNQFFADRTQQFGLHDVSLPVLGWGTQFLDCNNDGRLELFVSNGYTQDLKRLGIPFRMQPHLFEWTGERFDLLPPEQLGGWSSEAVSGRSVARLDWDLDCQADLVVSLLDQPSHVLTNATNTDNHGFSLRLVATSSARDAVGTTVTATIDSSRQTHQLTAGDGFQCSNERRVFIGCGDSQTIQALDVVWPSGYRQSFSGVFVPGVAVLVEGRQKR